MTTIEKPGPAPRSPLGFEDSHVAPQWAAVVKKHGGYDPATGTNTPLKKVDKLDGIETLSAWYAVESISAAYEEGLLTEENVSTAFATTKDAEALIRFLIENADAWVNERHFHAWMGLGADEDDAGDFDRIADYIRDNVLAEAD